jgi:hypothetical protein
MEKRAIVAKIMYEKDISAAGIAHLIGLSDSALTNDKPISKKTAIKINALYPEYSIMFLLGLEEPSSHVYKIDEAHSEHVNEDDAVMDKKGLLDYRLSVIESELKEILSILKKDVNT